MKMAEFKKGREGGGMFEQPNGAERARASQVTLGPLSFRPIKIQQIEIRPIVIQPIEIWPIKAIYGKPCFLEIFCFRPFGVPPQKLT